MICFRWVGTYYIEHSLYVIRSGISTPFINCRISPTGKIYAIDRQQSSIHPEMKPNPNPNPKHELPHPDTESDAPPYFLPDTPHLPQAPLFANSLDPENENP